MTGETGNHGIDADADTIEDDAPSIDGLMGQLSEMLREAEGWGGINTSGAALQKMRDAQRAAFKKEANLFRDVFTAPDGRKLLSIFMDRTLNRPELPEGIVGLTMEQITPVLLVRHAENSFVRAIIEAIAQAENKPNPTRTF